MKILTGVIFLIGGLILLISGSILFFFKNVPTLVWIIMITVGFLLMIGSGWHAGNDNDRDEGDSGGDKL
jgi:ABC-type amino acid transport system permease subunit